MLLNKLIKMRMNMVLINKIKIKFQIMKLMGMFKIQYKRYKREIKILLFQIRNIKKKIKFLYNNMIRMQHY